MNDVFVSFNPAEGMLRRYVADKPPLLTHEFACEPGADLPEAAVQEFRTRPPEWSRVKTAPYNPPPPANGSPAVARVALAA